MKLNLADKISSMDDDKLLPYYFLGVILLGMLVMFVI